MHANDLGKLGVKRRNLQPAKLPFFARHVQQLLFVQTSSFVWFEATHPTFSDFSQGVMILVKRKQMLFFPCVSQLFLVSGSISMPRNAFKAKKTSKSPNFFQTTNELQWVLTPVTRFWTDALNPYEEPPQFSTRKKHQLHGKLGGKPRDPYSDIVSSPYSFVGFHLQLLTKQHPNNQGFVSSA